MKKNFLLIAFAALSLTVSATKITKTVGLSAGDYTSLSAAIDDINLGVLTDSIELQIIESGTTAAVALEASGATTSNYSSVVIYPTVTGITITSNVTGVAINLNGADNVVIDGRVNKTGALSATDNLTISNPNASGTVIRFINDATNNTVKYANIKGANTTTTNGAIVFSTATAVGNNNNTIDNNNITNAGTRLACAVYSLGSATYLNSNNTISNNNIYDIASLNGGFLYYGVLLADYNTDWTITGNSFYETAQVQIKGQTNFNVGFIRITYTNGVGNNFTVKDNYMGGRAAQCGGTAFLQAAGANPALMGIYMKVGSATQSKVQGNVMKNITWNVTAAGNINGIYVEGGDVLIGGATPSLGNVIGASGAPITWKTAGTNTSSHHGINVNGTTAAVTIKNNSIAYFSLESTNVAPGILTFVGIKKLPTTTADISNNTIDNLSVLSTAANNVYGIQNYTTNAITSAIQNNTITNLNSNSSANAYVYGIILTSSHNTAGTQTYSGNFIAGLTAPNATGGTIAGISFIQSASVIYNNIISLTPSTQALVAGLHNNSNGTGSAKIYYNTIFIGAELIDGAATTAAYYNASTATHTRDIRNNIFYNESTTTSGTGKHYAVNFTTAAIPGTLDYNDYFVTSTANSFVGNVGNLDKQDYLSYKQASGKDANSMNIDPVFVAGNTANSYKQTVALLGVAIPDFTTDFDGTPRTYGSIGAYDLNITTTVIDVNNQKNTLFKVVDNGIQFMANAQSQIISLSGKMVWKGLTDNQTIQLQKGVYIVKAIVDNNTEISKVIIK